jgi:hypothetical protein
MEPIRAQLKEDVMGLGKKELEEELAESATKRKALEIEKEQTVEEKRRKLVRARTSCSLQASSCNR